MEEPVWGSMLATYRSYGCVGATFGQYVGNLQVAWGVLERVWGCMLATYRSYGACWNGIGAVCWQPACFIGCVGASLGQYVGNLQAVGNLHVLWGVLEPAWGCMLATYRSHGACWNGFGAVCWQPIYRSDGCVGASLGQYVGNLHVLSGGLGQ